MVLGQSAATAAVLAIDDGVPVQKVPYEKLKARLLADKQVLEYQRPADPQALDAAKLGGIVIDDDKAKATGEWTPSSATGGFVGHGYLHDNNADKGRRPSATRRNWRRPGSTEVFLHYPAASTGRRTCPSW